MTENRWLQKIAENPDHSSWYIERFRKMAADGADLHGEARFVDAMVERQARILDAGCGPGRVGGELHRRGHTVVGVDIDPALITAAKDDHPGPTWLVGDLATLDLTAEGISEPFDVIVSAGNVMTFLDPATRTTVLDRLSQHLATGGRLVVGFGAGRDYPFDQFFTDAESVGLTVDLKLSSWHLNPFGPASDFLVALTTRQ